MKNKTRHLIPILTFAVMILTIIAGAFTMKGGKIQEIAESVEVSYKPLTQNSNGYYEIRTAQDLQSIGASEEALSRNYILMNDIDCSGIPYFKPIEYMSIENDESRAVGFSGTFNGNGKTIKNAKIVGLYRVGLFGMITGGTVKNVILKDIVAYSKLQSIDQFGGLFPAVGFTVGSAQDAEITDVKIIGDNRLMFYQGDWNTNACLGGVAGFAKTSIIKQCSVKLNIHVNSDRASSLGGLVGAVTGINIEDCYSKVNINASGGAHHIGGLLGRVVTENANNHYVKNSYAIGNIVMEGAQSVGGLVGKTEKKLDINDSYAKVDIEGIGYASSNIGGLVGCIDVNARRQHNKKHLCTWKNRCKYWGKRRIV